MSPSTSKKTALITGSTDVNALGFTAALLLALKHDFDIILTGRREDATVAACSELEARLKKSNSTAKVFHLVLDVTSQESIDSAARLLTASDGPLSSSQGALDVLINNAGIGAPPGRAGKGTQSMFLQTDATTAQDMIDVFATNVAAVVGVTNAFLPFLTKSVSPRIVNISSARGSLSFSAGLELQRTGAMVYNTSKAALNMVTLMQAKNLPAIVGANLKVNAASPGHVKTPFNSFTGIRTLEEGASIFLYLATSDEDGPTGQLIGNHAPFTTDGSFVQIPW